MEVQVLSWAPTSGKYMSDNDEELIVRLARLAEQARLDPGEDITGLSDEEFIEKLFGNNGGVAEPG